MNLDLISCMNMESNFYYNNWFWFVVISLYLLVLLVFKALDYLWWRPRRIEKHFSEQGIKGPPYQIFIGNLKELVSLTLNASSQPMFPPFSHDILPRVLTFYHHWRKIYGATFLVWFGPTPRLTITEPNLIREIFILKSDLFEKNESPPLVRKLEGDGLLTLKGEKWAHHRKIITPIFYLENLKLMVPEMGKSMTKMLDNWSAMAKNPKGEVEIEVSECFQTLVEDVITRTVFGSSSFEDGKKILQLQAQQMLCATESFQKVFIPGYRFMPTKKNRISRRLDKEIRKSLTRLIDQRTKNSSNRVVSGECPHDLLQHMIEASLNDTASSSSVITIRDIVEECKSIFFAGKHTTSNLLTWTTVLLAMHPEWQEAAREEVLRVCGSRDLPTKDDVVKLKLVGMILNETLRLYPPAVATIRRAKVDMKLGDLIIPNGTELLIPILAVHHDQRWWGPDATKFNPRRFTKGVAHAANQPMAFMPFGLGGRRCIGQNLAILQAKLSISIILQRFSFTLAPAYQHSPTVLMMLYPRHGAPITFRGL